jgi:hypothetical protein
MRSAVRLPVRRGLAMIYAIIAMVALCAFVSLAVDFGRVEVAKTELIRAADASARAAAAELGKGSNLTTIQNAAIALGAANKCDGTPVSINASTDITFGAWDTNTGTFTALASSSYTSANAIKITARRAASSGNPIPLAYGRILGMATCDVKASVIAYIASPPPGITGLNRLTARNNLFIASYNSNSVLIPSPFIHNSNGDIGGNTSIDLGTGGNVYGDEYAGPSATVSSNGIVHGISNILAMNLSAPTLPSMSYSSNPGGVSTTPVVSGTVFWPGGTYYFTSLTMGDDDCIQFMGAATINMNGNVSIHDRCLILPYGWKPGNLVWYQAPGTTFTVNNNFTMAAQIIAPSTSFTANDYFFFGGAMIFKSISLRDNCGLFEDEVLTNSSTVSTSVSSVQ